MSDGAAVVAAIDIGTNTTGLLITDDRNTPLERLSTTTRLGVGVDLTHRLDPSSIERTLSCLDSYRSVIEKSGATLRRAVATSACRRAHDFADFARSARDVLGFEVELISGVEEGRLSYRGALATLDADARGQLVIDIGGGSTELMFGRSLDGPLDAMAVQSLEVGAIRLTEKYFEHDPPLPEELVNAIADVQDAVADACREFPDFASAGSVVGCSGTILTIAAVELGELEPSRARLHGFDLTRTAVEEVFRTLATESLEDRKFNPGLAPQRADIIVGGCCVLVGIMRSLNVSNITVSSGNILDGMCHDLIATL